MQSFPPGSRDLTVLWPHMFTGTAKNSLFLSFTEDLEVLGVGTINVLDHKVGPGKKSMCLEAYVTWK